MPTSTEEIDIAKLLINGRQGRAFRDFDRDMKEWLKAQYMHMSKYFYTGTRKKVAQRQKNRRKRYADEIYNLLEKRGSRAKSSKAQQNRTEQNRQKLKNRKNIQEQTKPYLQNKQLILACGSRARQRLPADGQKCDMESQVGHIAINRPDKAHQSLIYYARAHTHARSAKMTKNMAVLRSL